TMPTSMGMGGTENIGGRSISLWTPPGVYTVLDKGNPVVMDSSTFGLPKNSRLGYRETINYATKISSDGIYLHELDATVWAQGHQDTSHGCLNLNADNAKWFYDFSVPGDVVEVRNSGGPPLTLAANAGLHPRWGPVVGCPALITTSGGGAGSHCTRVASALVTKLFYLKRLKILWGGGAQRRLSNELHHPPGVGLSADPRRPCPQPGAQPPFGAGGGGGPPLTLAQNGDWTLSWDQWRRGSALKPT
ncbi:L,D-transpeptidase, partial [Mycobacterium avium]